MLEDSKMVHLKEPQGLDASAEEAQKQGTIAASRLFLQPQRSQGKKGGDISILGGSFQQQLLLPPQQQAVGQHALLHSS